MKHLLSLTVLFYMTLSLQSCRSVSYIPVETVKSDTLRVIDRQVERDSVFLRDSIYVAQRGDTVFIEKFRYLYRDKVTHDTIAETQIKTLREQVPVEVAKPLTAWQTFRLRAFWWLVGAFLVLLLWNDRGVLIKLIKNIF